MPAGWLPGQGVAADVHGRLPWYRDDWVQGCNWGFKVFAPATYIFFASALPALAFGSQLALDTEGTLTVVHVLVATALSGLVQSVLGGQPLLIIGVAEPIVLIYGFAYNFAKHAPGLGPHLFLPWAGWVCIWTSLMCLLLAVAGACAAIDKFTRFSGEVFGALIAILFFQVGIKGIVHEFQPAAADPFASAESTSSSMLLLVNGLWGLVLAVGVLLTSLLVLTARSWLLGRSWLRGFLADYGVPLMVIAWSGLSFAVAPAPGLPRRVQTPNTWEVTESWTTAARLRLVPGTYIAAALVPAVIITVLFYFDHNVSSQMAQQPEFNLHKPPAYHYDMLLLSGLTLLCGLLGVPPVNGVLPQAPMHTRSLACLRKRQLAGVHAAGDGLHQAPAAARAVQRSGSGSGSGSGSSTAAGKPGAQQLSPLAMPTTADLAAAAAAASIAQNGDQEGMQIQRRHSVELRQRTHGHSSVSRGQQQDPVQEQQHAQKLTRQQQQQQPSKALRASASDTVLNNLPDSAAGDAAVEVADGPAAAATEAVPEGHSLQLEVREQRVTNLLQSLLLAICLGITPAIQQIPSSVLWGYFMFMAIESLSGSQLWERFLLLLTDPQKRVAVLQREHAAYLQLVPFRVVAWFTWFQVVYLLGVWALTTWAGIAGVAFPLPIMALVPVRQYLLPRLFKRQHLAQLDAASYEEAPPVPDKQQAVQELYALGAIAEAPSPPLPVSGADAAAAQGVDDDDEREVLQHEFHGHQLKHHITAAELERLRSS